VKSERRRLATEMIKVSPEVSLILQMEFQGARMARPASLGQRDYRGEH